MTYRELWQRLATVYDEGEAKAIARMVYEVRYGLTMADLCMGKENTLPQAELEAMTRRLEQGEPVQYVLGEATFCGRSFLVQPGVLIPRPETQWLCHFISNNRQWLPQGAAILDIGTGSGCIACTLALEHPHARLTAWDISTQALAIAAENARRLHADVTFQQVDILNRQTLTGNGQGQKDKDALFDLIVSNPPYVTERERSQMARHVLEHEPSQALFVPDDDPLLFYRAIGLFARQSLTVGGHLLVEINQQYGQDTARLLTAIGFHDVTVYRDMFDNDRFISASQ